MKHKQKFHIKQLNILLIALISVCFFTACVGGTSTKGDPDISKHEITFEQKTYEYTGEIIKPRVVIEGLTEGNDYQVEYPKETKLVGAYEVTVTGTGKYTGKTKLSYNISPLKTSISKLKKGSKSFSVSWDTKTTQVTGYQLQYCKSYKFDEKVKTITIDDPNTGFFEIAKAKAKTKYYVRIRTYKDTKNERIYSPWSLTKKVTTKK